MSTTIIKILFLILTISFFPLTTLSQPAQPPSTIKEGINFFKKTIAHLPNIIENIIKNEVFPFFKKFFTMFFQKLKEIYKVYIESKFKPFFQKWWNEFKKIVQKKPNLKEEFKKEKEEMKNDIWEKIKFLWSKI